MNEIRKRATSKTRLRTTGVGDWMGPRADLDMVARRKFAVSTKQLGVILGVFIKPPCTIHGLHSSFIEVSSWKNLWKFLYSPIGGTSGVVRSSVTYRTGWKLQVLRPESDWRWKLTGLVTMKSTIVTNVTPCSPVDVCRRFGEIFVVYLV
jgi:hypothetical protein